MTYVEAPGFVLLCQLASAALAVYAAAAVGVVESTPLEWEKVCGRAKGLTCSPNPVSVALFDAGTALTGSCTGFSLL